MIGLAIFGTASLLIGLAPAGWWMIAARAVQGIGAAIVAPTSLALITAYFEGEARNRAVAWYGATAGIGASLGLLVGGALTDWISWRAAFLVNVPIAIAMIVGARPVLVETPRRARTVRRHRCPLRDARHGRRWSSGSSSPPRHGWGSARVIRRSALGAGPAGRRWSSTRRASQQPIMPLRLFRSRERSGAYAARHALPRAR